MKFLIPTEPDDSHAILVKLSLAERGHQVRLLFTADLPTKQKNSIYVDNTGYLWKSSDKYDTFLDNEYDVVWWRRARKPFLPREIAHPDDYKFFRQENSLFYESITCNMAPNAGWINSKETAMKLNSKLLQLKVASECGMSIPTTLCSNDPKDIRYFLLKHEGEGVIYKPLCSTCWFEEKQVKMAYTSKINFLELPNNKLLQLSPGIYQKEVKKKYELRVTCFGDYLVSAKLNFQNHQEGTNAWRSIPTEKMSVEPYMLPPELESKIRRFMFKTGLVFSCFDFIVSTNDEYIFIKADEQGQFLWIEELNPGFKMLDIFTNFLVNKARAFHWDPQKIQHEIGNYSEEMEEIYLRNMRRHVELNSARAQQYY